MNKVCQLCHKSFRVKLSLASQRFCSKKCWYCWHTKSNNAQYDPVQTECYVCKKTFTTNRYRIEHDNFHYCSRKCAGIHRRSWMAGPNHPLWTGGETRDRGANWNSIKNDIRARDGYRCVNCGMTEAVHIQKYHRRLTVHHKEPYRLSLDNSPSNLITLCVPCHRKIENQITKKLTPLEKLLMSLRGVRRHR